MTNQEIKKIEFKIVTPEETIKFIDFIKKMVQAKSANTNLLGGGGTYFTRNDNGYVVVPPSKLGLQGNFLLNLVAVNSRQLRDGIIPFNEAKEFLFDAAFKIVTEDNSNVLHHAICERNYELAKAIAETATKEQLLAKGFKGETVLHFAAKEDDCYGLVDLLIKKGGTELLDAVNDEQETALYIAVKLNQTDVALKLIEKMSPDMLLKKSSRNKNALDLAMQDNEIKAIKNVIQAIATKASYNDIKAYKNHPIVKSVLDNRAIGISVGQIQASLQSKRPVEAEKSSQIIL